jgi:hypothetical protein
MQLYYLPGRGGRLETGLGEALANQGLAVSGRETVGDFARLRVNIESTPTHDGDQGMGWHSDDEIELEQSAPIASVSLGGGRKFSFKHKLEKLGASVVLENGSVLVMHAPTQHFWHHSLTKTKRVVLPRINLTFRAIRQEQQSHDQKEYRACWCRPCRFKL